MRKLIIASITLMLIAGLLITAIGCGEEAEKQVTVGNKNFTEQFIIGQMIKQILEDQGFEVNLVSDLSSMTLREAMEAGDIDICAEYTGTGWMTHLGQLYVAGTDNNELYNMVKDADAANGLVWLDPIWNNNTYALACWPEFAEENDVETLSDLAALYNTMDGKIVTFVDFEFSTRPDGLPALEEHYGFEVDEGSIKTGAPGASLLGLETHECDIAMVFGTDAAIAKNGWHVFADDMSFFPPYDLTPYVNEDVLDEFPELEDILNELVASFPGGGMDASPSIVTAGQKVWQELNAKVDIDKMLEDEVAEEYLISEGLIGQ